MMNEKETMEEMGGNDLIAQMEREFEEEREHLKEEAAEFQEKYPDVDIWELEKDRRFRLFCGSRLYHESVTELYGDYLQFTRETEQDERKRESARRSRGTGSGSGRGKSALNEQETKALLEWNRAFPQMRMTAGEFKKR